MNKNKKGFTLVELVIVIAVIAILAGVMIATFANVVNKANESRKLQEEEQARLQQLVEDAMAKVDNENWLGREDLENILAEKLANVNTAATKAEVEAAVAATLNEYGVAKTGENTGLTESQLETIVERALSGSLTASQVEAIVRNYSSSLSATQIKSIVDSAVANGLNATQVTQLVKDVIFTTLTGENMPIDQLVKKVEKLEGLIVDESTIKSIVEGVVKQYGNAQVVQVVGKTDTEIGNGLQEALTEASKNPGSVVQLPAPTGEKDNKGTIDVAPKTSLKISGNMTLDLNGNTLHVASDTTALMVEKGSNLTITGGDITSECWALYGEGANITIKDGTITGGKDKDNESGGKDPVAAIQMMSGVLTIEDGEFTTNEGATYLLGAFGTSTVIINGGTFNLPIAISNNGSVDKDTNEPLNKNSKVIINGGTFIGSKNTAPLIYWPTGTLEINGGDFTCENSIVAISGGSLFVSGGTFKVTGNHSVPNAKSGTFCNGDAICIATNRSGYTLSEVDITIAGANITTAGGKKVGVYKDAVFTSYDGQLKDVNVTVDQSLLPSD